MVRSGLLARDLLSCVPSLALAMVPALASAQGGGLPPGFERSTVVSGLEEPTVMEFTPDGRFFVGALAWPFPTFDPGQPAFSPALAALVQEVVDRPDWSAGGFVGFVLDGTQSPPLAWRCVANFDAASPPVLHVTYAPPPSGCPVPPFRPR